MSFLLNPYRFAAAAAPIASNFTPADLFANGELGVWIDPSDFSTMWQDSAGTTPVTAAGDAVMRIDDKSGNTHHFTATTAPILRQDAGGNWYLEFNGTTQSMSAAFGVTFAQPNYVTVAFAFISNTTGSDFVYNGSTSGVRNGLGGDSVDPINGPMNLFAGAAGGAQTFGGGAVAPGTANHVASTIFDGPSSSVRYDGTNYSVDADPGAEGLDGLVLASNVSGSEKTNIKLYGLIVRDVPPSAADIAKTDQWLAGKCGVTMREFSPIDVFFGTKAGLWIDPSDMSTMWQDAAGTIPVTAAGDPVARIDDRTHNAFAFTGGATLGQDANGDWYLAFNGSTDEMSVTFGSTYAQSNYIAIAFSLQGNTSGADTLYNGMSGTTVHSLQGDSFDPINNAMVLYCGGTAVTFGGGIVPGTANHVASTTFNGASTTVRYDGATFTADGDPGANSLTGLRLAAKSAGGANCNCRIYGLVLLDEPPAADDIVAVDAWLGDKAGVASAVAFSPANLFAGTAVGGWWDVADSATCWQDTARTIPAGDGDPVGCVDNQVSGWPALLQATAAARPVRRYAGGLWRLEFDGVDDFMEAAYTGGPYAQPNEFCVGYRVAALGGTGGEAIIDGNSTTYRVAFGAKDANGWYVYAGGAGGALYGAEDTAEHVSTVLFDGASSQVWIDGTEDTLASDPGSDGFDGLYVGRNADAGGPFNRVDVYGVLWRETPFNEDRDLVEQWMRERVGPARSDPYYANTALIINGGRPDGTTAFVDKSPAARVITANGGVQYTGGDIDFTGSVNGSDYLSIANAPELSVANSADKTYEAFVLQPVSFNRVAAILNKRDSTSAEEFSLLVPAEVVLRFFTFVSGGSGVDAMGSTVISTDELHHVAITRESGLWRVFLDGVLQASQAESAQPTANAAPMLVGRDGYSSARFWDGYMRGVRVTHGVARYTANFTPPTPPFPIS